MKKTICCMSDLHGHLVTPEREADIYLIAGDVTGAGRPRQHAVWLHTHFLPWLRSLGGEVAWIAGNHDFVFQDSDCTWLKSNTGYLENSGVTLACGLRIWGTPYSLPFFDWAFMRDEAAIQHALSDAIGCDIVLSHGPPYGIGDECPNGHLAGSHAFREFLLAHFPRLAVFGHIHGGYGVYQIGRTICVNAAVCDEEYRPINKPLFIDIEVEDASHARRISSPGHTSPGR